MSLAELNAFQNNTAPQCRLIDTIHKLEISSSWRRIRSVTSAFTQVSSWGSPLFGGTNVDNGVLDWQAWSLCQTQRSDWVRMHPGQLDLGPMVRNFTPPKLEAEV